MMKYEPEFLTELWEAQDEIYEETKHLTTRQLGKQIRKNVDEFLKEQGYELVPVSDGMYKIRRKDTADLIDERGQNNCQRPSIRSVVSKTSIKMKEHPRIEFASDENIDEFAYEFIERVFEIEGALLTDESTLDDFKPIDYIPGHWQRRLSDIPESERDPYLKEMPEFVEPERYICWYPPVTDAEWTEIYKANRQRLLNLVEKAYGISLADFPEEELYVWKVAAFVKQKLLSR